MMMLIIITENMIMSKCRSLLQRENTKQAEPFATLLRWRRFTTKVYIACIFKY